MRKQLLVVGLLLALAPAPGGAQADPFRAIDRNGDGSISSEEWYGQRLAPVPFTVVDLNGDGRISQSEFNEWSSARGGAGVVGITPADRFRAIDKNRDGAISSQEWTRGSFSEVPFAAVDANKDGAISLREFSAWDDRRPLVEAPAPPPGTVAPAMSERLGTPVPVVPPPPPAASSRTPAPRSSFSTPAVNSSGGIPGSSPNMGSGSGLTTR